jgi:hypothetical protein
MINLNLNLNEFKAILPCCWNTCYCTVDCQYKHWNSGHRTKCTRKQRTVQQQTKV